jgi:uncharacterized protein (DUF1800 family)
LGLLLVVVCTAGFGAISKEEAALFLEQATWGPTPELITKVAVEGKEKFLDEQFAAPASLYPLPAEGVTAMAPYQRLFYHYGVHRPDQLRQRVGFALGQILVVSAATLGQSPQMVPYINLLQSRAFGNYRDLLIEVSLSPAMGDYLDNVNNQKPNVARNQSPNENYAREFLQLFSIGTELLNEDGTVQTDVTGKPLPAYTEDTVKQLALAFTGWVYAPAPGQPLRARNAANYAVPMVAFEDSHDKTEKTLLNGYTMPAGRTARQDLDDAITHLFNHPNTGPFVCVRLIRSLVTSNPSPDYVKRVVGVFNNNGQGVRGDLRAVVRAILLDPEASALQGLAGEHRLNAGKVKEPVLYVLGVLRAIGATVVENNNLSRFANNMGQNVFYPPSVFNYFHLDHKLGDTGLYGPELEIHTASAAIQRANFITSVVDRGLGTGTTYTFDALAALAGNPDTLIDELSLRLTHGTLPPEAKTVIRNFVNGTTNAAFRVNRALYLVATSPYAVVSGERTAAPGRRSGGRQGATRREQ